jgi:hypothetical protein
VQRPKTRLIDRDNETATGSIVLGRGYRGIGLRCIDVFGRSSSVLDEFYRYNTPLLAIQPNLEIPRAEANDGASLAVHDLHIYKDDFCRRPEGGSLVPLVVQRPARGDNDRTTECRHGSLQSGRHRKPLSMCANRRQ